MRRFGIEPATARQQLQKPYPSPVGIEPLPPGSPGRATGAQVGITDSDPITFVVFGDTGGIMDPHPQMRVAAAIAARPKPAFIYHVGDWVYFYGDANQYVPQFYEPYGHLLAPFIGIPGNHDGDPDPTITDPSQTGIATFMANFCTPAPIRPPVDLQGEFGRDTETQPWCDWTLDLGEVTIIGLYSNVPEGGYFEQSQTDWLIAELKAADPSKPLVVAFHHPVYSVDAHHGGSQTMGAALDAAIAAANRAPELVLNGHVHDYQRFTRAAFGKTITYTVTGNGGYHNLHPFASDATAGMQVASDVTFEFGDDSGWGFLSMTAGGGKLTGEYIAVAHDGTVTPGRDTFTV